MGAMDSSANLLFNISADPSSAIANVGNFRSLLTKDLATTKVEFKDWARGVFGDLDTTQGKMTAVAAGAAAMGLAIAAGAAKAAQALWDAGVKAAEFADQIEDGTDVTGLSAETISGLKFAADQAGVGYDTLIKSLVIFESNILKAAQGSEQQVRAFGNLGIKEEQIKAGQKDLLPLLMQVSDEFSKQSSTVEKAGAARELFGRGGAALIEMLSMGSAGLQEMTEQARELGVVLSEGDLLQAKLFRMEMTQLDATLEGMKYTIGAGVIPMMTELALAIEATFRVAQKTPEIVQDVAWWKHLIPGAAEITVLHEQLKTYGSELEEARSRMLRRVQALMSQGPNRLKAPDEANKAKQDFEGLTNILDQLRMKAAAAEGEESKLTAEMAHLQAEVNKAAAALQKLHSEGKIDPEAYKREMAALAEIPAALARASSLGLKEIADKRNAAVLAASQDLYQRIGEQQAESWQREEALWDDQMTALAEKMFRERTLTAENNRLLEELWEAGARKRAASRSEAFAGELRSLQEDLAAMVTAQFTSAERIQWVYDQGLVRYSQAEEERAVAAQKGEAEKEALRQQFAINRAAAFARYGAEMTSLYNSEGWQGMFGLVFAESIRGNEELLREWASSSNQSLMMVEVAMASLDQMGQRAFKNFAAGMGQNIAQALVYSKSIGAAMREATVAALTSLAAESLVYAIYSTGLGFLRLAQHDYPAAASAFTAAGIWGAVGVTAAVAGRLIAPKDKGAAGGGGAGAGESGGGAASGASGGSGSAGKAEPHVAIYIQGPVFGTSGVEEVAQMLSEAVEGRDVRLVASDAKRVGTVVR